MFFHKSHPLPISLVITSDLPLKTKKWKAMKTTALRSFGVGITVEWIVTVIAGKIASLSAKNKNDLPE